eukprot:gb/GECH01003602.1/.p1 GENE.gb/GECH01003602.1/~~gb/GECH01003602.1/.p1  ORF type:complete len:233 (+),score=62.65 gb/GECH01003602.1/:1-699(+)
MTKKQYPSPIIYDPNFTQHDLPGFEYYHNYVTEEEAEQLMKIIDSNQWNKDIRRRQQHYGYVYYHTRHNLPEIQRFQQPQEVPSLDVFDWLIERMNRDGIFPPEEPPTQCLVNEYIANTRIATHVDNSNAFGSVVAGLSLLEPVQMMFRLIEDESIETKLLLEPRSLYVLKNSARYDWKHGITQMKTVEMPDGKIVHRDENYRRISLTFREILTGGIKRVYEGQPNDSSCTW